METIEVCKSRLTLFYATLQKDLSACRQGKIYPGRYAIDRQIERAEKRANYEYGSDEPSALAYEAKLNFVALNEEVATIVPCLSPEVISNASLFIRTALERFTYAQTEDVQDVLNLELLFSLSKFGPGASKGVSGTHFVEKVHEVITVTKECLPLLRWMRKVDDHYVLNDETKGWRHRIEKGSCLSTVPKNKDKHRTIATEPLGNMSLQLAAGIYIEGALKRCGINISDQQPKNKLLAYQGSRDGSLCTIDLKDASDRITPLLIKTLWPTEWYYLFMAIRSPEIEIDFLGRKKSVTLNMMSTMGNGFTFPMMTLTLLALLYGAEASVGQARSGYVDLSKHAVFGDDIICPNEHFELVTSVLRDAGLKVNSDKSFSTGWFRESCGGDYYKGYDVTPFYVEHLSHDAAIYIAINKVLNWQSLHNCYLYNTVEILIGMLNMTTQPLYVPMWEDPFAGIQCTQVDRNYRKLIVVQNHKDVDLKHQHRYIMKCIIGGYVTNDRRGNIVYLPRPKKKWYVRYKVANASIPTCFRDGSYNTRVVEPVFQKYSRNIKLFDGILTFKRSAVQNARVDRFLTVIRG